MFFAMFRAGKTIKQGGIRVFNNVDREIWAVAVVGLGSDKAGYNEMEALDEGMENVRAAAGIGAQKLRHQGVDRIMVEGMGFPEQAAEGSALALWRYLNVFNKCQKINFNSQISRK